MVTVIKVVNIVSGFAIRALTGNTKYDPTEMTRKDQFINPYIGKDYNGSAYELVSMGFEYALTDYEKKSKRNHFRYIKKI